MPKTGENIYKRKDGRWEGRYIIGHVGNRTRYGYVYSRTYADTKKKLLDALSKKEQLLQKSSSNESFGYYAEKWLDSVRSRLKESTAVNYENILRVYIYPYFEKSPIERITNEDLRKFTDELLLRGGRDKTGLSVKTVSSVLSVMKNIFEFVKLKNIAVNTDTRTVALKPSQKTMRVFTVAEQEKLSKYLCGNPEISNMGILLCLYTGLRIGELCALKWEDISLENKTLTVNKTMLRIKNKNGKSKTKILITPPKSDCSVRTIPVPDCIIKLLEEFDCEGNTYFLTGKQDKYIEPRTMQNRFKAALKNSGVESANFHVLRHTFATRCVELGFDIKSLSEILGHASVNITLSRYVHPSMELKKKNMDRLSELLAVI